MDTFKVSIRSPEKTLWEGSAVAVSAKNTEGPFDILASHANFVTMLKSEPVAISLPDGTKKEFTSDSSVLAVQGGEVHIYTDV
jgi:F-type H+-transporting ATPase subunit epsilon